MSRRATLVGVCTLAALVAVLVSGAGVPDAPSSRVSRETIARADAVDRPARVFPEFAGVVIPPNLCPVNFVVNEPGRRYHVRIASVDGEPIELTSDVPAIVIPPTKWRDLLSRNRGNPLTLTVTVQDLDGRWHRFRDVVDATIAREDVDRWLVYRIISKYNQTYKDIGVYQRDLEGYDETTLLHSASINRGCMNCHTFADRKPSTLVMHVRSKVGGGMLLVRDGKVTRVDTRSRFNPTPAKYIAVHPSGRLAAFAESKLLQFGHTVGENADVFDAGSDLALYLFDANLVTTTPAISSADRQETYPSWSPDGRYLYFSSAPKLPPRLWKDVRYDLMRVAYDVETGRWGRVETVLAANDTGLSMTHPRVSPDGRWLLFCASGCGSFPIWQTDADLYIMDLGTRTVRPLTDANSDTAEAWHTWSSNGRWIVFSSRRRDGVLTKLYFSHVDEKGNASKPLILPQKDPTLYDRSLHVYNLPEFATGPVDVTQQALIDALRSPEHLEAGLDPAVKPRVSDEELSRKSPQPAGIE